MVHARRVHQQFETRQLMRSAAHEERLEKGSLQWRAALTGGVEHGVPPFPVSLPKYAVFLIDVSSIITRREEREQHRTGERSAGNLLELSTGNSSM